MLVVVDEGYLLYTKDEKGIQGEVLRWSRDDRKELIERYHCVDGVIQGEYTLWYHNGSIRERSMVVDDKYHGECKTWLPDGRVFRHKLYVNGNETGENIFNLVEKDKFALMLKYPGIKFLDS